MKLIQQTVLETCKGLRITVQEALPESTRILELNILRNLIDVCLSGADESAKDELYQARQHVQIALRISRRAA